MNVGACWQKGPVSQSTAGKWGGVAVVVEREGSLTFQKGSIDF
jgi:hypothetical protein